MKKIKTNLIPLRQVISETFDNQKERISFYKNFEELRIERRKQVLIKFGSKLKKARVKAGITQSKMAEALKTDVANISRIEHGRHNLTVDYIVRLSEVLGRPVKITL
jgi:ribosome-binding protein aMBF1 (putative translation factor)